MKKNQQGFGAVEILILVVIVGLIGAVGWLVYDRQKDSPSNQSNQPVTQKKEAESSSAETPKSALPESYTEYKNATIGFSFGYPKTWGSVTGEEKPNTGAKGSIFYGTFSANDKVKLIYNSADYDAFPGGGCALSRRVIVKKIDPNVPIDGSKIIKTDSGLEVQYKEGTYYTDASDGGCPIDGYYDAATFNTKNSTYPAVQLRQEYKSARDAETQKLFTDVLKTVKVI